MGEQQTFVGLLRDWVQADPAFPVYNWVGDDGSVVDQFTFASLDERARAIAAELRTRAQPGDRAVLLHPPGLEFVAAFFGCLYAGVIAVPAYPPTKPRDVRRLTAIARSARPAWVLGPASLQVGLEELVQQVPELGAMKFMVAADVPLAMADQYREPTLSPDSVAFLQYTSGSTGDPKGVMVTQGNLLANERMICKAFGHSRDSVVVGWLPHFHDMGLIGNVLQPLYVGCRDYLMSTGAFLREPMRWLRAISTFGGTTSGGPNFAYELCALRAARLKGEQDLNLESWRLAFVGAEPVRPATLASFVKSFSRYGFRESSLYPCYGLAEATLFVTGGELGAGPRHLTQAAGNGVAKARGLVSCGTAAENERVAIVDPKTSRRVGASEEGEIWVSGANIAQGYWQRPEESDRTFRARISGEDETPYLRTGDLGVLVGDELLVTGRLKDLIIVRGQNFYPQDIEQAVEAAHPAVRAGSTAAFSFTENGEECVAVITEVARAKLDDTPEMVCQRIRAALIEEADIRLDVIVLLAPQTIFKTSSGKIERQAARRAFLAGELDVVGFSAIIELGSLAKPLTKSNPEPAPLTAT